MRRLLFAAAMTAASPSMAQDRVVLGTATPGGGFPVFGAAFSEMVNAQEPTIRIETRNTRGSTENVPLLEAGQLDIALVQGEVATMQFAKPGNALRIVTAMYGSPGLLAVRGDSAVRAIADLRGKPVALGAKGSGLTILGRHVLDAVGVEVKAVTLDNAGDGPLMVQDGRVEALWGAGVGWPGFVALGKQGARFVGPSESEIDAILAKQPVLKRMAMPAGALPGLDRPIATVGSWSFVIARADLPEELAWRLARAIHRAEAPLASRLEQARETTAQNTVAAAPSPDLLHPGVRRYLREAGFLK